MVSIIRSCSAVLVRFVGSSRRSPQFTLPQGGAGNAATTTTTIRLTRGVVADRRQQPALHLQRPARDRHSVSPRDDPRRRLLPRHCRHGLVSQSLLPRHRHGGAPPRAASPLTRWRRNSISTLRLTTPTARSPNSTSLARRPTTCRSARCVGCRRCCRSRTQRRLSQARMKNLTFDLPPFGFVRDRRSTPAHRRSQRGAAQRRDFASGHRRQRLARDLHSSRVADVRRQHARRQGAQRVRLLARSPARRRLTSARSMAVVRIGAFRFGVPFSNISIPIDKNVKSVVLVVVVAM